MCTISCLVLVKRKTDQNRCSWFDILDQFYKLLSDRMYAALNNAPKSPTFLQSLLKVVEDGVSYQITGVGFPTKYREFGKSLCTYKRCSK